MSQIQYTPPELLVRPNVDVYQEGRTILPQPTVGIDPGVNLFGIAAQGFGVLGQLTGQYLDIKKTEEQQKRLSNAKAYDDEVNFQVEMAYINGVEEVEVPKIMETRKAWYNQMIGTEDLDDDTKVPGGRFNTQLVEMARQGQRDTLNRVNLKNQEFLVNSTAADSQQKFDSQYKELVDLIGVNREIGDMAEVGRLNQELQKLLVERQSVVDKETNRRLRSAIGNDLESKRQAFLSAEKVMDVKVKKEGELATTEAVLSDFEKRFMGADTALEVNTIREEMLDRINEIIGVPLPAPSSIEEREAYIASLPAEKRAEAVKLLGSVDKLLETADKAIGGIYKANQEQSFAAANNSAESITVMQKMVSDNVQTVSSVDPADPKAMEARASTIKIAVQAEGSAIQMWLDAGVSESEMRDLGLLDQYGRLDLGAATQAMRSLPKELTERFGQAIAALGEIRSTTDTRMLLASRKQQAERLKSTLKDIAAKTKNRITLAKKNGATETTLYGLYNSGMQEIAGVTQYSMFREAFPFYRPTEVSDFQTGVMSLLRGERPDEAITIKAANLALSFVDPLTVTGFQLGVDSARRTPINTPFFEVVRDIQQEMNSVLADNVTLSDKAELAKKANRHQEVIATRYLGVVNPSATTPTRDEVMEASQHLLSSFAPLYNDSGNHVTPDEYLLSLPSDDVLGTQAFGDVFMDYFGAQWFDMVARVDPNNPAATQRTAALLDKVNKMDFANMDIRVGNTRSGGLPDKLVDTMASFVIGGQLPSAESLVPFSVLPQTSRQAVIKALESVVAAQTDAPASGFVERLKMLDQRLVGGKLTLESVRDMWNVSPVAMSIVSAYNNKDSIDAAFMTTQSLESSAKQSGRDLTIPIANKALLDAGMAAVSNGLLEVGAFAELMDDEGAVGVTPGVKSDLAMLHRETVMAIMARKEATAQISTDYLTTERGKKEYAIEFNDQFNRRFVFDRNDSGLILFREKPKTFMPTTDSENRALTGITEYPTTDANLVGQYYARSKPYTGTNEILLNNQRQAFGVGPGKAPTPQNIVLDNVGTTLNRDARIALTERLDSIFEGKEADNAMILAATALVNTGQDLTPVTVNRLAATLRAGQVSERFRTDVHHDPRGYAVMLVTDLNNNGRTVAAMRLMPTLLDPSIKLSVPTDRLVESLPKDIKFGEPTNTELKLADNMIDEKLNPISMPVNGKQVTYRREVQENGDEVVYREIIGQSAGVGAPALPSVSVIRRRKANVPTPYGSGIPQESQSYTLLSPELTQKLVGFSQAEMEALPAYGATRPLEVNLDFKRKTGGWDSPYKVPTTPAEPVYEMSPEEMEALPAYGATQPMDIPVAPRPVTPTVSAAEPTMAEVLKASQESKLQDETKKRILRLMKQANPDAATWYGGGTIGTEQMPKDWQETIGGLSKPMEIDTNPKRLLRNPTAETSFIPKAVNIIKKAIKSGDDDTVNLILDVLEARPAPQTRQVNTPYL